MTNLPIPVHIFEPISMLERVAQSFAFAPQFLEKAGLSSDPIEQLKLTTAFIIATINSIFRQEKPFNPVVGETFQGRINGIPIFVEQISHHPPICYYHMKGENFFLYGQHEVEVQFNATSISTI